MPLALGPLVQVAGVAAAAAALAIATAAVLAVTISAADIVVALIAFLFGRADAQESSRHQIFERGIAFLFLRSEAFFFPGGALVGFFL